MMSQKLSAMAVRRCKNLANQKLSSVHKRCVTISTNPLQQYQTSTTTNNVSFHHKKRGHRRCRLLSSASDSFEDMEEIEDLKESEEYYPSQKVLDEDEAYGAEEAEFLRRKAIRDEINSRTGRLWTDRLELTDDDWAAGKALDDLPDWTEEICSRVSRERVQVHPDGVPTLANLAKLSLPPPQPDHPALGNPKVYVKHRKKEISKAIYAAVESFAQPQMEKILSLTDWNEKQDAIDDLFEQVHEAVKKSDPKDDYLGMVLASQPTFPKLAEQALEEFLRKVAVDEKFEFEKMTEGGDKKISEDKNEDDAFGSEPVPIFLDLMKVQGAEMDDGGVPELLRPLKPHPHDGTGRMIEEWELSANEKTRRIMGRECIREIAELLSRNEGEDSKEGAARVYVKGRKGAGKSAALSAIVASARLSGHIVLYLPDGDRLRKNGFYLEPNNHRKSLEGKLFDLPILSKELCTQLVETHSGDFEGMQVSKDVLDKIMGEDELKSFSKNIEDVESASLSAVLKIGSENVDLAAACYGAAMDILMTQTEKPFTIVIDQFNCFFDHGYYFHGEYEKDIEKSVPLHKITLFKPLMDAMGVERNDDGEIDIKEPVLMKRGGIVAGVTESHAVARKFTSGLTDAMTDAGVNVVDVPQYSPLEVEHILSHFEIIGIGRLRFDRGETVMNKQEVAYLRMVSGGWGQNLLDACVS